MSKESHQIFSGFTWRSALALVFSSLALLPVSLYLNLISGAAIAGAAVYITVILFVEISSILGSNLSKQEIFVIYMMAGTTAGSPVFINWVYRQYYVSSFITKGFIDPFTHKPIPDIIPSWWAPQGSSIAYMVRSFINPAWVIPIVIALIQYGVLWIIQEIALTMITAQIFLEYEQLPFPWADVNMKLITTLTERQKDHMYVFTLSAFVSALYSLMLYGIPTLMQGAFNVSVQVIPFPWIDLTTGFFGIEQIMPGAMLGIATDPLAFAGGFLLPLNLVTYILVGSISIWTFGNWITLNFLKGTFPLWASEWRYGMNLSLIWQRSQLRVWIFPQVAFALALAALTMAQSYKSIVGAIRSLMRSSSSGTGFYRLPILLAMYVGAVGASIILFQVIVPDFPIWITVLSTYLIGFLIAIAGTKARGEAMASLSVPYVWQGTVLLSGYEKIDAFLISPVMSGTSVPLWVEAIKTAKLTNTRPMDFFKAYIFAVILYHVFSFIYVSFFWSIAPIPSSVYPYTLITWPIGVINDSMWYTRQIVASPNVLALSFLGMLLIGGIGTAVNRFTGFPFSFVGLVTGTATLPPYAISMFIGGVVGQFVIRRMRKEWWDTYKAVVVAGLAAGEGIMVGLFAGLVLMMKSVWVLPF